jgi:hypothetical protein
MEWFIVAAVALASLIWSAIFLVRKLLRLRGPILTLTEQLQKLSEASSKAPELAKLASALGDDPAIHVARRLELKREASARKRQRERRLRSRDF